MSRILRRPMFRGGPVSSYGTGIADSLGTPRVGLEKGGTWWDRFQNWTSRNVPAGEGITGAEVVEGAKWMQDGKKIYGPFSPYGEKATIEDMVGTGHGMGRNIEDDSINLEYLYSGSEDPTLESSDVFMKEWVNEKAMKENELKEEYKESGSELPYEDWKIIDAQEKAIAKENEAVEKEKQNALTLGGTGGEEIFKTGKSKLELENERLRKIIEEGVGGDDPTNVETGDLESMIGRYEKLLGGDKAFSQDVGDMAFRLAGAKGNTAWEKLQNWFGEEGKAGPSRTEKIKQAAAMLGIKGEQAQKLYETKLKNTSGQTQKAVEYIASITGASPEEALKKYLRKESTFAATAGKYKKEEGALTDQGFKLAAEDFYEDAYKGDVDVATVINEDKTTTLPDGWYSDAKNKIMFEVKDKVVISDRSYN
jgi:hypothetical protein